MQIHGILNQRRFRLLLLVSIATLLTLVYFTSPSVRSSLIEETFAHINPAPGSDPTPTSPPRILLVSAFFPLKHSKHSQSDYEWWLGRFLGQISTDVYFFAPPDSAHLISAARPSSFPMTLNTTFSSAFDIPPLKGLQPNYTLMHSWDREKLRHSPELYAVWNAKAYFLSEAIDNAKQSGKTYDYVFWNDAGSFRDDHGYKVWPDPKRVAEAFEQGERKSGVKKDDLMFFPVAGMPYWFHRYWKEDQGPVDAEFSEGGFSPARLFKHISTSYAGSFFGGSPSAAQWWSKTFYAYHDYYLSLSYFVGKDQTVFNALFFLFPKRFIAVYYGDMPYIDQGNYGACGYGWWYYHFWFGEEEGRRRDREGWLSGLATGWKLWRERVSCTLAPIVPMQEMLQGRFGWGWTPPERRLEI